MSETMHLLDEHCQRKLDRKVPPLVVLGSRRFGGV
ncbi:MAG: hypothetical protein QOH71_3907 [Blastocatellia bacterium]|jgi:hypothetical protein|nr:hypothetical protein [Blastocatellia bacterium]